MIKSYAPSFSLHRGHNRVKIIIGSSETISISKPDLADHLHTIDPITLELCHHRILSFIPVDCASAVQHLRLDVIIAATFCNVQRLVAPQPVALSRRKGYEMGDLY